MNSYPPPDPQHPGQAIGVIGLMVILGIVIVAAIVLRFNELDRDQKREIARLSSTCPAVEAGQQLVSSVRQVGGEMHCIYTSTSGYGRSMRSRPAVPGRPS